MTARQVYALKHPCSSPADITADRSLWRDDPTRDGNVLRTVLAVDR